MANLQSCCYCCCHSSVHHSPRIIHLTFSLFVCPYRHCLIDDGWAESATHPVTHPRSSHIMLRIQTGSDALDITSYLILSCCQSSHNSCGGIRRSLAPVVSAVTAVAAKVMMSIEYWYWWGWSLECIACMRARWKVQRGGTATIFLEKLGTDSSVESHSLVSLSNFEKVYEEELVISFLRIRNSNFTPSNSSESSTIP